MSNQQKIKELLIIVEEMNLGGTEKSLLTFLNQLKTKKQYQIKLLLLKNKGELLDQIPPEIEVQVLSGYSEFQNQTKEISVQGIVRLIKQLKFTVALKAIRYYLKIKLTHKWYLQYDYPDIELQKYTTDVAIAFSGPHYFITWFTINKIKAEKKIQWIRFDVAKIIAEYDFGHLYYPRFDKIYCVSQSAYHAFVNRYPKTKSKTAVFANIVSADQIKQLAEKGETFDDDYSELRILTVGRLSKEKGQQMIPEIVKRLKDDGYTFRWYLIGDGSLREEIENEIRRLKIEDYLILLGNQINPYPYFNDCDLYVQTSYHEGYCQTVHEAKLFEKPVVTTDFINASNLIVNDEDGFIVPINSEGIYLGVRELMDSKQKRNEFRRFLKKDKMQKPEAVKELVDSWFLN